MPETAPPFRRGAERVAIGIACALAAWHLAVLVVVVAARLPYAFDIEWMEGGTLVEAWRLRQGLALHVPPSAEFIPFPYTPLYPALVAALSFLTRIPVGYVLGRGVSIAAFALGARAMFDAARREGASAREAWSGLGVLAAGFAFTGGWFDLVRVDTLYLCLVICGFAALRRASHGWHGAIWGAVLLTLAFFTKQTAAVFAAAGAAALARVAPRRVPAYLGTLAAGLASGYALLQTSSGGWFRRYAFEILGAHSQSRDILLGGAWWKMVAAFWPTLVLVAAAWLLSWRRPQRLGLSFWGIFAAAGAAAAALGASIQWSEVNVYLPALWGAAIAGAVAAAAWRANLDRPARFAAGALAPALLCLQIATLGYDPRPFFPGDNRARAERFVARLRELPGEIQVPQHPFAALQAGKQPGYHAMALGAAERAGLPVPESLSEGLARQRWSALVLDRRPGRDLDVFAFYKLAEFLPPSSRPRMLTGFDIEPRYLLVPKRAEPPEPGTRPLIDFESGSWDAWAISGDAFGPAPAGGPARLQGPVGPFHGRFLANSGHPTARAVGRALSPEFEIPAATLRILLGGRRSPAIAARLLVDGRPVAASSGSGSDEMRPVTWEVGDWGGRRARLELVDEDPDGYLLADDLVAQAVPERRTALSRSSFAGTQDDVSRRAGDPADR